MKDHIITHKSYEIGISNPIGEINDLPSKTIPGMTLSLEELVKRYVRGDSVQTFMPSYTDDPDMPDNIDRLDEIERLDMARQLKAGIEDYRVKKSAEKKVKELPPEPEIPFVE